MIRHFDAVHIAPKLNFRRHITRNAVLHAKDPGLKPGTPTIKRIGALHCARNNELGSLERRPYPFIDPC
jgi:hypothetical protein